MSSPIKNRGNVSNTAAEAQAAEKAIDIADRRSFKKLIIVTDSEMLVNFYENRVKWEKEGWKDKDLYALKHSIKTHSNMDIKFAYVRAHSGDKYNDEADRLAKNGAKEYARIHGIK